MCGRFTLRVPMTLLVDQFQIEIGTDQQMPLRFNVAPTQDIPIVRQTDDGRELAIVRWGLIPSWSKDPKSGPLLINARSDTVGEKPAFRSACKSRRCLIPSDGFYEWKKVGKKTAVSLPPSQWADARVCWIMGAVEGNRILHDSNHRGEWSCRRNSTIVCP
jgi:putative SOS response-associated peptidase YedK